MNPSFNPPHSTRMEQELLCLLCQQSPRVPEAAKHYCAQRLTGADFYHEPHRLAFEAAVSRLLRDGKIYLPLVAEDLAKVPGWEPGVLEKWLRDAYLAGQTFPTGEVNIAAFCEQLRAYAQARAGMEIGMTLARRCETEAAVNAADFAAEAARKLADVAASKVDTAEEPPDTIAVRLIQELDGGTPRSRVATRLPELDDLLSGGYENGTLNVIAARRGVGKSAVGLHLALVAAGAGKRTVCFSQEMSREQMVGRALSMLSGVQMRNRALGLTDDEREQLRQSRARLAELPVLFDCRPGTLGEIQARMASHYARGEMDLAIVDYLQKIIPHKSENTQRWLTDCVGAMKNMAGLYSMPVLLLAQVRREGEFSPKVPTMSCLKGSGSIEEDADSVLLMWPSKEPNRLCCNLEKNRHGATGGFDLYVDWKRMKVSGMDWREGQKGCDDAVE